MAGLGAGVAEGRCGGAGEAGRRGGGAGGCRVRGGGARSARLRGGGFGVKAARTGDAGVGVDVVNVGVAFAPGDSREGEGWGRRGTGEVDVADYVRVTSLVGAGEGTSEDVGREGGDGAGARVQRVLGQGADGP